MEMPDEILARYLSNRTNGVVAEKVGTWHGKGGANLPKELYHHDRIVQALKRENEELKAKLVGYALAVDELQIEKDELQAKLDKANNALDVAEWALLLVNNVRTVQYADQKHIKDALETIKFAKTDAPEQP